MARRVQGAARPAGPPCRWLSLKSSDFAAAIAAPTLAKTAHFVLQHLAAHPASARRRTTGAVVPELSTDQAPTRADFVDNLPEPSARWLGLVVPKRHAKRSVTRNLIKRQMRAAVARHGHRMAPGQWLIRLRAPFDARQFPSAASAALRVAAHGELELAFTRVVAA